jgi:hypothetical protein
MHFHKKSIYIFAVWGLFAMTLTAEQAGPSYRQSGITDESLIVKWLNSPNSLSQNEENRFEALLDDGRLWDIQIPIVDPATDNFDYANIVQLACILNAEESLSFLCAELVRRNRHSVLEVKTPRHNRSALKLAKLFNNWGCARILVEQGRVQS